MIEKGLFTDRDDEGPEARRRPAVTDLQDLVGRCRRRRSPRPAWRTAPPSCSTRWPRRRSPARRRRSATPTSSTSRRTSTARGRSSPCSGPCSTAKSPDLATQLESSFADLQKILDGHRTRRGFPSYTSDHAGAAPHALRGRRRGVRPAEPADRGRRVVSGARRRARAGGRRSGCSGARWPRARPGSPGRCAPGTPRPRRRRAPPCRSTATTRRASPPPCRTGCTWRPSTCAAGGTGRAAVVRMLRHWTARRRADDPRARDGRGRSGAGRPRRAAGGHRRGPRAAAVPAHADPGPRPRLLRQDRPRRLPPARPSSTSRASRATTSTRRAAAATSSSRPAPTTRRSRCTRSGTSPGWRPARPRSAGASSASAAPRRRRRRSRRPATSSGSRTARTTSPATTRRH